MIQVILTIYAAVKRAMKAMKWLVYLAGFVLIYLIGMFGDFLADDIYPDDKGISVLVFFIFLAVFVCASWALYYLMERLSGYEGSFSQFMHEKTPEPRWIAKYNKTKESKNRKTDGKV